MVRARGFFWRSLSILAGLIILASPLLLELVEEWSSAGAAGCWEAKIIEQWTDVEVIGSVLRVSVQGQSGLPVTIRSMGGFETVNFTGTKPEYGPFVAEFAPLSKGIYYIEPQGLGIVFEIWLDGKGYARVDFTPLPCAPTATPTVRPATATAKPKAAATRTPTPTPISPPSPPQPKPASGWQGRVVQHLTDLEGSYWSTIAVKVVGRPAGQEVEIRSDGWSATCKTGTKPEHGPDACEFGALHAGTYRLTPRDLGTHLDVTVDLQEFVLVEFHYTGEPEGGAKRWVGSVVENTSGNEPTEFVNSAIAVIVAGRPWHEVEIRSNGWSTTAETGYKPDYGPDACEFGGLRAATYTIIPKDLDASVQVTVDGWGWAKVRFDQVAASPPAGGAAPSSTPAQPTPTNTATPTQTAKPKPPPAGATSTPTPSPMATGPRWNAWIVSNTSGQQVGTGVSSVIVVRVINYGGVPVHITGGGGWSATCITGTKPEYGPDACEFGGLWPGTYLLWPEGADIELEVEMDGLGVAHVEFAHP